MRQLDTTRTLVHLAPGSEHKVPAGGFRPRSPFAPLMSPRVFHSIIHLFLTRTAPHQISFACSFAPPP
jgi:hypothetical protein